MWLYWQCRYLVRYIGGSDIRTFEKDKIFTWNWPHCNNNIACSHGHVTIVIAMDDGIMIVCRIEMHFWLFAHLGVGGLCLVCAELERPTPSSSLRSSFLFDSNSHQTHYQNYL